MYVSQETPEQTHTRLSRVLAESQLVVYERPYAFVEVAASRFPVELVPEALAFVRDDDVWSALVPSSAPEHEKFVIFGFHFTQGLDNSGFVGWLASHLKSRLGTGILVICGQNSGRGGIFDYWGAPLSVASQVIAEVQRLRERGNDA
jgi:Family of unknown function (DUF6196)